MKLRTHYFQALVIVLFSFFSQAVSAQTSDKEVTIIELAQTPGAFETTELHLKPGKYQFKVANEGVDHEVGFVVQKASDKDGDLMETAIKSSFTTKTVPDGKAEYTGVITLTEGEYVYSCPLNPTPHYKLQVKK